jgi:3-deoxy-D-manno-octulosonic-acid transferase
LSELFYNISIYLYQFIIWSVSPFNKKAKLWIEGRKSRINNPTIQQFNNSKTAWFHCASLGEFEQGRPVIEKFKTTFPDHKILLTFFSPSGYEVRKNYDGADYICYLPADTPANAREFIEHFQPSIAFFVKYEFWYNYLRILREKQIPVISFSAIFRENQIFFKWYGGFYRNILKYFTHIFVQNKTSLDLLQNIGIQNVTVGGDTRFDRVKQIADARKQLPIIETFKDEKPLLIIGSCWQEDFEVIVSFLNKFEKDLKVIIAPHEIRKTEIETWKKQLKGETRKFSELNDFTTLQLCNLETLIIDNIGMLSSLYQYADFAWIGGAYGKGLHNILEAATFGLPIFFGNKNYKKFQEAIDLERLSGAKVIVDTDEFESEFRKLYNDEILRNQKSEIIKKYVEDNTGGTDLIIDYCNTGCQSVVNK